MGLAKRKIRQETAELNITAFLNLMVILVPFLLITAVFSRVTILELNLPGKDAVTQEDEKIELNLELVLREDGFEVRDENLGRIKSFPKVDGEVNWKTFTKVMVELKQRFPEKDNITLLLAPNVDYKTLIQVMDKVRSAEVVNVTDVEVIELFPNIAIGDAPEVAPTNEAPKANKG